MPKSKILPLEILVDQYLDYLLVEKGLSKKYRFQITEHVLEFHGICSQCQKQLAAV